MICPYCTHSFPLTWRRYWGAPFGRHTCPSCERKSRLSTGLVYWSLYMPLVAISPLVAVVLAALLYGSLSSEQAYERINWFLGSWWAFFPVVVAVLLFFPIDRIIDERLRKLRPTKKVENAV
jgi:hypothetical protein